MDKTEIEKTLVCMIEDSLVLTPGKSGITGTTHLTSDLNMDSVEKLELVMEAEDEFGVKLDEKRLSSDPTVADIVELVAKAVCRK